jgi:hypothetical protein
MLRCKFVDRFWERFWEHSDAWEWAASNEIELWAEESDRNRELIDRAIAVEKTDPAATFRLCLEAAEEGSVWSMLRVGWHYWAGAGVAADLGRAQEYYHRAIRAGSWMATIYYARLLAIHGHYDDCESVLKDGVAADFVPAYFWLAWFRYERSKTREMCRKVRPLLEYAAGKGHPAAAQMLARWMLFGKFGLREILRGAKWKLPIQWYFEQEDRALRA